MGGEHLHVGRLEHRQGERNRAGRFPQSSHASESPIRDGGGAERRNVSGGPLLGWDLTARRGQRHLAQQERISGGRSVGRRRELGGGRAEEIVEHAPGARLTERCRPQPSPGRERSGASGLGRAVGAEREDEDQGMLIDPPRDVLERVGRGLVRRLQIVDQQRRGLLLAEMDARPVDPVQQGRAQILGRHRVRGRPAERRSGCRRGPGQHSLGPSGFREGGVQQLSDHSEGEPTLCLCPGGAQAAHIPRFRQRESLREQSGLPDSRIALDQQRAAETSDGGIEAACDRRHLTVSLDQPGHDAASRALAPERARIHYSCSFPGYRRRRKDWGGSPMKNPRRVPRIGRDGAWDEEGANQGSDSPGSRHPRPALSGKGRWSRCNGWSGEEGSRPR